MPSGVLKLLNQLAAAQAAPPAWDLAVSYFTSHGFSRVNYGLTRFRKDKSLGPVEDTAYLTSFDQRYIDFYFGSGFYARTALYRWAMTNSGCCSWRWVEQELLAGELTPGETEAMQLNLRWQIRAGMTISFPEALTRQKGALGLAADPGLDHDDVEELWSREGAAIEAVAQMLHLRLCQLPLPSRRPELTLRQREALEWIAEGKTNQDVATLMGVSIATIEKHLRLARQALDVDTTAQAIAKAMASNNIFRLGPDVPKK